MREKIDFTHDFGSKPNSSIIKVIGVGGGGGNAVKHMYREGIVGVDFLVCNTDQQALENNPIPVISKLVLGSSGLGAGAIPEVARDFAEESAEKLREFIGAETQMLFITAGMGKGTGTGAAPIVARIAREMNILTIGVVTYPFNYENRREVAEWGIAEMRKYVDSLIIIKNEKIFGLYGSVPLSEAFSYVDNVLKNSVQCIAEMITMNAIVNIDFNDVKTSMKDSKSAMLGIATANGEKRAEEVFEKALHSPLLDLDLISNATNLLFFVSYGPEAEVTVDELQLLSSNFDRYKSSSARVIWGYGKDDSLSKDLKLSVVITGYQTENAKKTNENRIILPSPNENLDKKDPYMMPTEEQYPNSGSGNKYGAGYNEPVYSLIPPSERKNMTPETNNRDMFGFLTELDCNPVEGEQPVSLPHLLSENVTNRAHTPIVTDANLVIEKFTATDDLFENDEFYAQWVNTPAAKMESEQVLQNPAKATSWNFNNGYPENDANEFLHSMPD